MIITGTCAIGNCLSCFLQASPLVVLLLLLSVLRLHSLHCIVDLFSRQRLEFCEGSSIETVRGCDFAVQHVTHDVIDAFVAVP